MLADAFVLAVRNLKQRLLRSGLTALGIIIGVTAIVAIFLISDGLENAITTQFEEIGSNTLFVLPGSGIMAGQLQQGLTQEDVDTIEKASEVENVLGYLYESGDITYGREEIFFQYIAGIEPDNVEEKISAIGLDLAEGRWFSDNEKLSVVVGSNVVEDIFDKSLGLKNRLTIKEKKFEIVGVMEEIGNNQDDSVVYMPLDTMYELFDKEDELSFISLKVKQGFDPDAVASKLERMMEKKRGNDRFEVWTSAQTLEIFGSILIIIQVVLGGIAAISLLVGALGIMNSMFTAVMERTKEIGIMKSVGATNKEILSIFLFEAGLLGLGGGVIGITLGYLISLWVSAAASSAGYSIFLIQFKPSIAIIGLGFAGGVGILSGLWPAWNAAKLHPVDALRDKK